MNPIAYAIVKKNGEVIGRGALGKKEYIDRLKEYDYKKRFQQSHGGLIAKGLRAKIARLQKTTLETAISQILSLAAKHGAIIAIEDLGSRFKGAERSIIPKRTYKRVEDLLANALNFAGLLRIGMQGPVKYWGGLLTIPAAGTSGTCSHCRVRWRANAPKEVSKITTPFFAVNDIIGYSRERRFANLNIEKRELEYEGKDLSLNSEWRIYSRLKPGGEIKNLGDLKDLIAKNKSELSERALKSALSHQPTREAFICHACGFSADADENAAVNIARRGIDKIGRLLTFKTEKVL